MTVDATTARQFARISLMTVAAVYFLILVGGVVRASGAGMGCPDWPTCFGQWVPPTDVSQLPADYQQRYADRGYADTAFNPVKTWTEYLNRLTGVSIGLLILTTAWRSRHYRSADPKVFYGALVTLGLVMFQAWLGSAVVASNLKPFIITLHMLLALVIVCLLIYVASRAQQSLWQQPDMHRLPARFRTVLLWVMAMTVLQIIMGTQVREAVDVIANEHDYIERQFWRDDFPVIFYVHRSFSALILFLHLWLGWQLVKTFDKGQVLYRLGLLLPALVVTGILAGVSLDRLGFPAVAQPVHLLMANLIFGGQFFLALLLHDGRDKVVKIVMVES
ncbi:MAG: COX15/CtaA family protein [Methylococcales bacterium]|nr:COX15/CtaA family protein [Methylococcales bacterium]